MTRLAHGCFLELFDPDWADVKRHFFAQFIYINDLFTKTGSGQTKEKLPKRTFFLGDARRSEGTIAVCGGPLPH
jgi:hypothetical protein